MPRNRPRNETTASLVNINVALELTDAGSELSAFILTVVGAALAASFVSLIFHNQVRLLLLVLLLMMILIIMLWLLLRFYAQVRRSRRVGRSLSLCWRVSLYAAQTFRHTYAMSGARYVSSNPLEVAS